MTLAELRNKILAIRTVVEDQSRAAPEDAAMGLAILMCVDVVGEVACNLKRIADATERQAEERTLEGQQCLNPGELPRHGQLIDIRVRVVACTQDAVTFQTGDNAALRASVPTRYIVRS